MAELDQNQADTGTAEATAPASLDSILDTPATDVPAQEQGGEADLGGISDPHVPLKALKRERERRQKADRQVEELRAELERFDNAKYGFDEPQVEERLAALDEADQDPGVSNYNRSYANFISKHGKEAEAKVDAATKRMTGEQQEHVRHLVRSQADPVAAIHAYAGELGLLDFKGLPIEDVLASKGKQEQPQDTSQFDRQVAELNRHGQEVAAAERRATVAASRIDFVSEYGKAAYNELDRLSIELAQSGHPVGQQFIQAVQTSADPISTAAQFLHQLGVWQGQNPANGQGYGRQQAPQQQPQMNFPSNLANRRSVGQRSGPSYGGPTPLNDIFRH